MRKIDSLRAAITAALPELAGDPARLRVWIEKGTGQSRQTASGAFALSYQVQVLITELAADVAVLALALFDWLRINQPERLAVGAEGFSFDADILDNGTADLLVQIDLTENAHVTRSPDGITTITWLPEPAPLFVDDTVIGPPLTGADLVDEGPLV